SALLKAYEGGGDLDPSRAARIAHAAGGNPLFLQQMLAMIGDDPTSVNVPPTVQALIAARLDRLESPERAILEVAAVEGQHFDAAGVSALTATLDKRTFDSHLAALVRKQLVEREPARLAG